MCELGSEYHSLKAVPRLALEIAEVSETCDGPRRWSSYTDSEARGSVLRFDPLQNTPCDKIEE